MLGKKVEIAGSGSIRRFKPVFKEVLGMDLGKDPDWQFICDCEKIRDCLLHANGRIDLSRNKDEFGSIIARSGGLRKVRTEHVEITGEFLDKFHIVTNSFITKVEAMAKP